MSKKDKKDQKGKKDKKAKKSNDRQAESMSDGELTAAYLASQLTRGQDALYGAERRAMLSDLAGTGGLTDVSQGAEMLLAAEDIALVTAAVDSLNEDDLVDAMEVASISGELTVLADVVAEMGLTVLSDFLFERSERLRELSTDNIIRFGTLRALAESMDETGEEIAEMGDDEVAEGLARLDLADAAMSSSEAMASVGESMIAEGLATLAAAYGAEELEGMFDLSLMLDEEE